MDEIGSRGMDGDDGGADGKFEFTEDDQLSATDDSILPLAALEMLLQHVFGGYTRPLFAHCRMATSDGHLGYRRTPLSLRLTALAITQTHTWIF